MTKILKDLYSQSWPRCLFAVFAGLVGGICGAELLRLISEGVTGEAPLRTIAPLFFLLCIAQVLFKTCSQLVLMDLTQEMVCRLRIELSRKVLHTPYRKLESMGKARLLVILTADIASFTNASELMPSVFSGVILIAVCLGYVALISWQVFTCLALAIMLGTTTYTLLERRPQGAMRKMREQLDVVYRHFRSLLEGSRELQLNASHASYFVDHVISPSARSFRTVFVRAMTGYTLVLNFGGMLTLLIIGLLVFVMMPLWLPQPAAATTTVTLLMLYLIQPIGDVLAALPYIRQSEIALGRIRQLDADLTPSVDEIVDMQAADPFGGPVNGVPQLTLRGVCHQFPGLTEDKPFTLGPIDLAIQAGELLYVVGGNGSGKTTLAMLLLGLYEPETGHIELNGVAVDHLNLEHYRQYFSAIFADFHFFDEIFYTLHSEAAERAERYLEVLGLAHKVKVDSNKFTSQTLSLGQRKRMALVSSYLEDRPIYLFDEWAADQDPDFKRVFYTELLPELKRRGKTVIVISHDDAYFHCADRIVKLAEGALFKVDVSTN
jgi:putative pyoverdin transport system ATP-binding/permease protein